MQETGAMEGEITKEKMDNFLADTPAVTKPATVSPETEEQAKAHVDAAFTYWTEFGKPTLIITNAANTDITCTKKQKRILFKGTSSGSRIKKVDLVKVFVKVFI